VRRLAGLADMCEKPRASRKLHDDDDDDDDDDGVLAY
jgi:hypothetical protein